MAIIKVTQKDLDLIRVEAEDVTTLDDKYFLMEKLHKYIEVLDAQVDALDYDNSVQGKGEAVEFTEVFSGNTPVHNGQTYWAKEIWFVCGVS